MMSLSTGGHAILTAMRNRFKKPKLKLLSWKQDFHGTVRKNQCSRNLGAAVQHSVRSSQYAGFYFIYILKKKIM